MKPFFLCLTSRAGDVRDHKFFLRLEIFSYTAEWEAKSNRLTHTISRPWTSNQSQFIIITFFSWWEASCGGVMVGFVWQQLWEFWPSNGFFMANNEHLFQHLFYYAIHAPSPFIHHLILFCLLNLSIIKNSTHVARLQFKTNHHPSVPLLFQLFGCSKYRVIRAERLLYCPNRQTRESGGRRRTIQINFFFVGFFLTRYC